LKILDKITVIFFTVCLLVCSITLPAIIMGTTDSFYVSQFKDCNIYPDTSQVLSVNYIGGKTYQTADFTQLQINEIIKHISSFLSGEKDSFSLKLDKVTLNGQKHNNVEIFGEEAVSHMEDVKKLFDTVRIVTSVIVVIIVLCVIWMIYRKKDIKQHIFKYSLLTVVGILISVILFIAFVFFRTLHIYNTFSADNFINELWTCMHYIFFPADPSKFSGSFFNDTLTSILTIDFFMNCVKIIVINVIAILFAWIMSGYFIDRKRKQKKL